MRKPVLVALSAITIGTSLVVVTPPANADGPFPDNFIDIRQVPRGTSLLVRAGRGSFTAQCGRNQNGHHNPDNFIVAPGVSDGAHHVHDYVGNLSTDGFSTDQSLAAAGTTCRFGDKSPYFWPVLRSITPVNDGNASASPSASPTQSAEQNRQQPAQPSAAAAATSSASASASSGATQDLTEDPSADSSASSAAAAQPANGSATAPRAQATASDEPGGSADGNVGGILLPRSVTLRFRANRAARVVAMPRFIRIITGDAKAATNGGANARAQWTCTGFTDRTTTKYPLCPRGSQVVRILDFPSCWDGQNTDSANHRTHVVFPDADGACASGLKPIPQLRMVLTYSVNSGPSFAVDSFPEQSHNPITDHGDFVNVMPDRLMAAVVNCLNRGQRC